MTPPIVLPLTLSVPEPSLFFFTCLASSLVASALYAGLLWNNPWRMARLPAVLGVLLVILFQWPTVILAEPLHSSLPNAWFFAIAVNATPLCLAVWICATRFVEIPHDTISSPRFAPWQIGLPLALTALFVFIYLARVPYDCTALYALFVEPTMTLLARELSVKLAGSSLATYSYGALANTTAPIMMAFAGTLLLRAIISGKIYAILFWPLVVSLAIIFVMLSGAKGLFLPSLLVTIVSAYFWNRNFFSKVGSITVMLMLLLTSFPLFEVARERQTIAGDGYNFASCAARIGACAESRRLLASLHERDISLGLTNAQVTVLEEELELACNPQPGEWADLPSTPPLVKAPVIPPTVDWLGQGLQYAKGIAYRAFVIPTQVASWHYLYVDELGKPGLSALPFARHFGAKPVDMSQLVYHKYGVIYSSGDRTSTSTSPTSFILGYPAYAGWAGFALVLGLIIALDLVVIVVVRALPSPFLGLAAGLLTAMSMNFVVSDFVTVMISHGGAATIGILTCYAIVNNATRERFSLRAA